MTRLWLLALLSGCSTVLGIADLTAPDGAAGGDDADRGVDVSIPGQARIEGVAQIVINGPASLQPLSNAPLALVVGNMAASIGTTTVAQDGSYAIAFDTGGSAVDASIFVQPVNPFNYPESQVFPPVLTGDLVFDFRIFETSQIQSLGNQSGTNVDVTKTFIEIIAVDSMNRPAAGVAFQVLSPQFQVHYADPAGVPVAALTTTSSSGIGYVFNLPPNLGTVTAIRDGAQVGARTIGSPSSRQLVVLVTVDDPGP